MSYVMLWYRNGLANYVGSLMDYVARVYSPALGRFVSADTIVPNPDGPQLLNRYTYVRNSPLSRVDPGGNCDVSADKAKDPCWQRLSDIEKWFPNVTIQGDAYDIVDLNALLSGLEMMRDYFGSQQALYMAIGKVAVLDPNSRRFSSRNPACGSSATSGGCTVSGLGITAVSFRRKDIQTVVHEFAHAYDFNVGYHGDRWFQGMLKGGSSTTYGNTGGPVEDFAETVAWAVFSDARGSGLTARFAEDWGYAQPSKDRRDSAFAVKQYVQSIAGLVVSPSSTPSPLNSALVSPLPTPSVRP